MPYIGKQPIVGNFQVCDAISVVNGQAAYTMQVGGSNVEPENANHMLVSLNGILQKPGSSFTISGSTITFASNLATGDVIDFITLLGDTLNTGAPSDDTVTAAKLNNSMISGLTALTSAPADTDEFIISDAGTLKRIDASLVVGGGKILQVVSAKKTSNFNTSSTSFVDVGLEATITPSATSSKISVYLDTGGMTRNGVSSECPRVKILRAGSDNYGGDNIFYTTDALPYSGVSTSFHYIDEPSSTSSLLYKVQMETRLGNECGFAAGSSAQFASLILMEISG